MQLAAKPLSGEIPIEVQLQSAPLVHAIAQIRFPPVLSIAKIEKVADFQEVLRHSYPHLEREDTKNIELDSRESPRISEATIWRLADQESFPAWRATLGIDFVALETSDYRSRNDFIERFEEVVKSVETLFQPAAATRIGLRYIDQLKGEAFDKIEKLIRPSILGILQPTNDSFSEIRDATEHSMTQARFSAVEGAIQGRWGVVPPNASHDPGALRPIEEASWILDLDMFSTNRTPFRAENVTDTSKTFARRLYSVFRHMVTNEFLEFYGQAK